MILKKFMYGYYTRSAYLAFYYEDGEEKSMEFSTETEAKDYFDQD